MTASRRLGTWAITGAGGQVGRVLREGLRDRVDELRLLDRTPVPPVSRNETSVVVDILDAKSLTEAMTGTNGVLHLAAIADEAAMTALLDVNIAGTHHVLEAARQNGVRRVVLASTNHVTGMYPAGQPISVSSPVRPDSFYGVSKVAMEALGRLYVDKFGLEVACIRIGSCLPKPTEPRHRHTWLSHRDTVAAFEAAMTANDLGFATFYAASANRAGWWLSDAASNVAYRPLDDADAHLEGMPDYSGPQGGHFASANYTLAKQEGVT